jgi:hypothetical protein
LLKKPQNVYLPIDKFQAKVFKKNEGERSEWVTKFALALAEEAEEPFAKELLNRAQADLYKDIVRGWRFNARRSLESSGISNPTDKQVHEKCIDEFGDEYIEALELLKASSKRIRNNISKMEADESTAGAPTREDGEFKPDSGNAGNLGSATPAKPSLAYAGKNGLVRLTDDEYAMLLQELGNKRKADKLIDSLDYSLAEGKVFHQPHFHVLTHWQSYREDKAAEAAEMAKVNADARAEAFAKRGYKTAEERQQEEIAKVRDFCTGLRNGTIKIANEG